MRHSRNTWTGAFHHVMNRGLNKQKIFADDKMKKKYIELMAEKSKKYKIKIYAYCIMDNHFHIVLENSSGFLSGFMKSLNGHYGQYYRHITNSKGYVFEDRFKSTIIQNEEYLITAILYVLYNPVRSYYLETPFDYTWSSINDYFNSKKNSFLDKKLVEELYSSKRNFLSKIKNTYYNTSNENNFGITRFVGNEYYLKIEYFLSVKRIFEDFETKLSINFSNYNLNTKEGRILRNCLLVQIRDQLNLPYKEISKFSIFSNIKTGYLPVIYFNEKRSMK